MKLIDGWQKAWKLHSVWLSTVFATVAGLWAALPDAQQQLILNTLHIKSPGVIAAIGFACVVIARLKAQPPKDSE